MRTPPPHRIRRKPGWFRPVPLRARNDGWSELRQCGFLVALYLTGSVAAAARHAGMSRAGAYHLRERTGAEGFARAWDRVLWPPGSGHPGGAREDFRKVTDAALLARLESGLIRPVIYRGRMVAVARKPDNSALFRLLRRTNRAIGRTGGAGRER